MRKATLCVLVCVMAVMCGATAEAAGIDASYWRDRPLIMEPGESAVVPFNLQNNTGVTDYWAHVTMNDRYGISTLLDTAPGTDYLDLWMPLGTTRMWFHVQYDIPLTGYLESYDIGPRVLWIPADEFEPGGVHLGLASSAMMPILITPPAVPEPTTLALFGLGAAGLVLRRRRRTLA